MNVKVVWKRGDETQEREFTEEQQGEIVTYNTQMYVDGWEYVGLFELRDI